MMVCPRSTYSPFRMVIVMDYSLMIRFGVRPFLIVLVLGVGIFHRVLIFYLRGVEWCSCYVSGFVMIVLWRISIHCKVLIWITEFYF